jgi:hypothetical protein
MLDIVDLAKLKEWRPYVIVGSFVVAAVLTPPDVISQLMMAIPMCLLFELGLALARFVTKRSARQERPDDQACCRRDRKRMEGAECRRDEQGCRRPHTQAGETRKPGRLNAAAVCGKSRQPSSGRRVFLVRAARRR